jgi:Glycosyl hydrolase catalytic core
MHVMQYSCSEVLAFMKQVVPWLEKQEFVAGYSWFSFMSNVSAGTTSSLFHDETSDELTPLGQFYASVTTQNVMGDQTIIIRCHKGA